jgi:serine/threonine-protein kinase HipA
MADRSLDVLCFGQLAGRLVDAPGGMEFRYADRWLESQRPPLSQSLPLSGEFGTRQVIAYFGGLLPEGAPRATLARQLGISANNDFGLLEQLGGDTAGAVSLLPPGTEIPRTGTEVEWLDERELGQLIDELPQRPMHADEDGEYRLSLAGVQDKLPVVVRADGRVGLTKGRTPSTHILKTPIERFDDTVANEAFCLALGRELGIDTVLATPRVADGRQFLLVARYDRRETEHGTERLHQEDICQALSVPSDRKYQAAGGPGMGDCFALVRTATAVPARETIRLLDDFALNFIVGNHDAHGKNFSLLYVPDMRTATLAPAYDVMSSIVYLRTHRMSKKMAMKIGSTYSPDDANAGHLAALLTEAGLGGAAARRRLRGIANSAPAAAQTVRARMAGAGWDSRTLASLEELVGRRAQRLLALTHTPARRVTSHGSANEPSRSRGRGSGR